MIKKDRTPKGDGNKMKWILYIKYSTTIKKDRTPRGETNYISKSKMSYYRHFFCFIDLFLIIK